MSWEQFKKILNRFNMNSILKSKHLTTFFFAALFECMLVVQVSAQVSHMGDVFCLQFPYMPEGQPILNIYSVNDWDFKVNVTGERLKHSIHVYRLRVAQYAVPRAYLYSESGFTSIIQLRAKKLFALTVFLAVSPYAAESFQAIPIQGFGTEYFLLIPQRMPSVVIVSVSDETLVEIRFFGSNERLRSHLNAENAVVLGFKRNQAFLLQNCDENNRITSSGFTPARVTSNLRIGVIVATCQKYIWTSACQRTNTKRANGVTAEMLIPGRSWGKLFVVPDIGRQSCDPVLHFLPVTTYTVVKVRTGRELKVYTIKLTQDAISDQTHQLTHNKGVIVTAARPVTCYVTFTHPCTGSFSTQQMMLIVPVELFLTEYVWCSPEAHEFAPLHFYVVVAPMDNFFLKIDLKETRLKWTRNIGNERWMSALGRVSRGTHIAFSSVSLHFGLYVMGINPDFIFIHPAGFYIAAFDDTCYTFTTLDDDMQDNDCDGYVDEERLNGIDDDNDDKIDEDFSIYFKANTSGIKFPVESGPPLQVATGFPQGCACPSILRCKLQSCSQLDSYITCLQTIANIQKCSGVVRKQARHLLQNVHTVAVPSGPCVEKCPTYIHQCMQYDTAFMPCSELAYFESCMRKLITNPTCTTKIKVEARRWIAARSLLAPRIACNTEPPTTTRTTTTTTTATTTTTTTTTATTTTILPTTTTTATTMTTATTVPKTTVEPVCKEGWIQMPDSEFCYRVFRELKTWVAAKHTCKMIMSFLTSVNSEEEQIFLNEFLPQRYWIGLSDIRRERRFVWDDDGALTYTNWSYDQPDHATHDEDCVFVSSEHISKQPRFWSDTSCLNRMPFICKQSTLRQRSRRQTVVCSRSVELCQFRKQLDCSIKERIRSCLFLLIADPTCSQIEKQQAIDFFILQVQPTCFFTAGENVTSTTSWPVTVAVTTRRNARTTTADWDDVSSTQAGLRLSYATDPPQPPKIEITGSCQQMIRTCTSHPGPILYCNDLTEERRCLLGILATSSCDDVMKAQAREQISKKRRQSCTNPPKKEAPAYEAFDDRLCGTVEPCSATYNAYDMCGTARPYLDCLNDIIDRASCYPELAESLLQDRVIVDTVLLVNNCARLKVPVNGVQLIRFEPDCSMCVSVGLSTLFFYYALGVSLNQDGCHKVYFDYCLQAEYECHLADSWHLACAFQSNCQGPTNCSETISTHPYEAMCSCVQLGSGEQQLVAAVPTPTFNHLDFQFRVRVSSSARPDNTHDVLAVSLPFAAREVFGQGTVSTSENDSHVHVLKWGLKMAIAVNCMILLGSEVRQFVFM